MQWSSCFVVLIVVVQSPSWVWLCNPMDHNSPGFPAPRHLPEFAQVHVYWVSDAIQPSHPLSPSSPPFSLSQHQGLFQCVSCSCSPPTIASLIQSRRAGILCHIVLSWKEVREVTSLGMQFVFELGSNTLDSGISFYPDLLYTACSFLG